MYTRIWNKYLPVIRILLKKSAKEPQSFAFNCSDFEKIGPQKKTGFNFTLEFRKGRLSNFAGLSDTAKELSAVLLQDSLIGEMLQRGEYHLTMNTKFELVLKLVDNYEIDAPLAQFAEELG